MGRSFGKYKSYLLVVGRGFLDFLANLLLGIEFSDSTFSLLYDILEGGLGIKLALGTPFESWVFSVGVVRSFYICFRMWSKSTYVWMNGIFILFWKFYFT